MTRTKKQTHNGVFVARAALDDARCEQLFDDLHRLTAGPPAFRGIAFMQALALKLLNEK